MFKSFISFLIITIILSCQVEKIDPTNLAGREATLKEAELGSTDAQFKIAYLYDMEKDYENAIYWYRKSAETGHTHSRNRLFEIYHYGIGVEKSQKEAYYWLKSSARKDYLGSRLLLAKYFYYGFMDEDGYKKLMSFNTDLSPEKLEKIVELTNKFQMEAKLFYAYCNQILGDSTMVILAESQKELSKKVAKEKYDLKAFKTPEMALTVTLAFTAPYNHDKPMQDFKDARKWFKKRSEKNDIEAMYYLGVIYENGYGLKEKDLEKAKDLFARSALQGYEPSIEKMAHYKLQDSTKIDFVETIKIDSVKVAQSKIEELKTESVATDSQEIKKEENADEKLQIAPETLDSLKKVSDSLLKVINSLQKK